MKKSIVFLVLVVGVLFLAGCAVEDVDDVVESPGYCGKAIETCSLVDSDSEGDVRIEGDLSVRGNEWERGDYVPIDCEQDETCSCPDGKIIGEIMLDSDGLVEMLGCFGI